MRASVLGDVTDTAQALLRPPPGTAQAAAPILPLRRSIAVFPLLILLILYTGLLHVYIISLTLPPHDPFPLPPHLTFPLRLHILLIFCDSTVQVPQQR